MFSKVLPVIALVAYAQAGVLSLGPQATSYSSISNIGAQLVPNTLLKQSLVAPTLLNSGLVSQNVLRSSVGSPVLIRSPLATQSILRSPISQFSAVPLVKTIQKEIYADAVPQYSYQYGVKDLQTGDMKEQQEVRDGDVVKGAYSLVQPDGVVRTVRYSADGINGFNAQVEYNGQVVQKGLVAKTLAPSQLIY